MAHPPRKFLFWLCLAAVAIPFIPALWGGFTNWDDDVNVANNPFVHAGLRDGLLPLLTKPYLFLYVPVTYAFFWAAYHLWGGAAVGYHALNLACHLVSAALLYQILLKILKRRWPALLACAWWAVHPLQVEPVAWITGLKDVLSVMLALASWRLYIAWREPFLEGHALSWPYAGRDGARPSNLLFGLSALAFLLACLSKPGVVLLPVVFAGYDLLISGRKLRELRPLAVFLAVAVLAIVVTMTVQRPGEAGVATALSPLTRLFMAADSATFYLKKILWPAALCPVYGRTMEDALAMPWAWLRVLTVCAAAAVAWSCGKRWRLAAILFAAGWAPVSGLVPFGYQAYSTVADRYACLPMLGVALALGNLLSRFNGSDATERVPPPDQLEGHALSWPYRAIVSRAVIGAWILALAALTWSQTAVWRDSVAVWERTLEYNHQPAAAVLSNYGSALFKAGNNDKALNVLGRCIKENPDYALGHYNLGRVYQEVARWEAAKAQYVEALRLDGTLVNCWLALGVVAAQMNDYDGCVEAWERALRLDPGNRVAAENLQHLWQVRAGDTF